MKNFFTISEYDCIEDPEIALRAKMFDKASLIKNSGEIGQIAALSEDVNFKAEAINVKSEYINDSFEEEEEELYFEPDIKEIELYDFNKTYDENFATGSSKKYILFEVDKIRNMHVTDPYDNLFPTPQSKCLVNFDQVEEYSSLEFTAIDYDTLFGTRFTTFIKYNSDFFACDERVLFEGILIKFKAFGYKPFYWSKEVIFKETGIKKDRATKIIDRFVRLGIISTEVRKSKIGNRPQQITYYTPHSEKIIELTPEIFKGREEIQIVIKDLEKYLGPVFKNPS